MANGVTLGQTATGEAVSLTYEMRRQGTYVIGVNGTGKSSLLRQIAHGDMRQKPKHGLCVIDPHGDLIDDVLALVPDERLGDLILFDPSDEGHPFCLNLFAPVPEPSEIGVFASEIVAIFRKILGPSWTPEVEGVIQNVTLTLLARDSDFRLAGQDSNERWIAAMDEIPALLAMENVPESQRNSPPWKRQVRTYREQFYSQLVKHQQIPIWEFWNYIFDQLTPRPRSELTLSVQNSVRRFLANPTVRNIVAQTQNKLDFSRIMAEGKILLVNLSRGKLGEANSAFLGSVIVAKLVVAVFQRASQDIEKRAPFHIICDEFQNFATSSFPSLLTEARKYNVDLVIAHQYRDQLRDWVQGATSNVGNFICFRLGGADALEVAREFDATPVRGDPRYQPVYTPHLGEQPIPSNLQLHEEIQARHEVAAADSTDELDTGVLESLWRSWAAGEYSASSPDDQAAMIISAAALATFSDTLDDVLEAKQWLEHLVSQPEPDLESWASDPSDANCLKWMRVNQPSPRLVDLLAGLYRERTEAEASTEATYYKQATAWEIPKNRVDYENALIGVLSGDETAFDNIVERAEQPVTFRGPTLYQKVPGPTRLYSDMYQQIANELTHLPNFQFRCKLAATGRPPLERAVKIQAWPDGMEDPKQREKRRVHAKRQFMNKREMYTRPRAEVSAEFDERYRLMLHSIGMSWKPGNDLPLPAMSEQVLLEED